MKMHTGSCTKQCGHKLDFGHVLASPTNTFELALSRDPRVVEFYDIDEGGVIEFVYAPGRPVAAIYNATASQLGIKELMILSGGSR